MAGFSRVLVPAPNLRIRIGRRAPDLAVAGGKVALDAVGAAGVETRLAAGA